MDKSEQDPRRAQLPAESPKSTWELAVLWTVAIVAGTYFRAAHLLADTPFWDEWHPLLAVKRLGFARLFSSFGVADQSIPVTLYLKALTATVGLGEMSLRAPFLLAGVASIVLLPLVLVPRKEKLARATFALLLALAPQLVFYSRLIRPYAITTLLALCSLAIYRRVREEGAGRKWSWLYAACVASVAWLLPVHVPFCLAPLLGDVIAAIRKRENAPAPTRLLGHVLRTGVLLVPLLGPALFLDFENLNRKLGIGAFSWTSWLDGLQLLAGSLDRTIAISCIVLGVAAGVFLLVRGISGAATLGGAAILQVASVALAQPQGVDHPAIVARYLLPSAVAVLALVARFLEFFWQRFASRLPAWCRALVPAGIALLLYSTGPLPGWVGPAPDNFASLRLYTRMFPSWTDLTAPQAPRAYDAIASLPPDSSAVLEVPYAGYSTGPFLLWQSRHHQEVFLGLTQNDCIAGPTRELPPYGSRGFDLHRFLALGDLETLRRNRVRFVAFHRSWGKDTFGPRGESQWVSSDYDRCVAYFERLSGRKPIGDESLALFDLGVTSTEAGDAR